MKYKTKIFGTKISKNDLIAIISQPQINLMSIINDEDEENNSIKTLGIKEESFLNADFNIDYLIINTDKVDILTSNILKKIEFIIIGNNFLNTYEEISQKFDIKRIYLINFLNYINSFQENINLIFNKNNFASFYLKSGLVNVHNMVDIIKNYSEDYALEKDNDGNFFFKITKNSNKLLFKFIKSNDVIIFDDKEDVLFSTNIDFDLIKKSYTNVFLDIIEEKNFLK